MTILILLGLFVGLVGGPIASLLDYHSPSSKTLLVIHHSRIYWIYIRRYNDILWDVKEIELMSENCADILRVSRSYRLSSASNDFAIPEEVK